MKINLNQSCSVVLTKEGADTYNSYLSQFTFKGHNKPDKVEGFVHKTQLWELMQIYGKSINLCIKVPFEFCEIDVIPWREDE